MNRPQIYIDELAVFPVVKNTSFEEVMEILLKGQFVLIEDYYSTGLSLLNTLKKKFKNLNKDDFNLSRKERRNFRELSHKVLLEVENHRLSVKKAPDIPWFKKLYPEEDYFVISFPDVQALNSSWQWYKNGIEIPGLLHKIHPWYGVYFPTRFEHIELFNDWLDNFGEEKKSACDIGAGCGILSFLLEKNGYKKILATDINPNAIKNMEQELEKYQYKNIKVKQGDFFAKEDEKFDLIVFNPPWLPEPASNAHLDMAVYYSKDLFPEFFKQAEGRLKPNARLVLMFSNLIKLTHPDQPHPIEDELNKNKRFVLDMLLQKSVSKGSKRTLRNTSRRAEEQVELWVLKTKT